MSACTAAPPIVVQHRELRLQGLGQRRTRRSIIEGPYDEDDRWTLTRLIKSDFCAVSRKRRFHRKPSQNPWRFLLRRKGRGNCSLLFRGPPAALRPATIPCLQTW